MVRDLLRKVAVNGDSPRPSTSIGTSLAFWSMMGESSMVKAANGSRVSPRRDRR